MVSFPSMKSKKGMFDKQEEIHGFVQVDFSDHEFASFLKKQNPDWTWDSIGEFNRFMNNQMVIALVKYKNDYPVARTIWIKKELIS